MTVTTDHTPDEIRHALAHCSGSESYHRWSMLFRRHVATDGVKVLAELCGAYWLLDAIVSYHPRLVRRGGDILEYQRWVLEVVPRTDDECRHAFLRCFDLDGKRVLTQKIHLTDFPLDEGCTILVKPIGMNAEETAYNEWCLLLRSED